MKNTFVLFVLILVGLTGLPVQADAQGGYGNRHEMEAAARRGGAYPGGVYNRPGGYGYGGYVDPIYEPYIQQMMRLPEGLASCQIDFTTGKVTTCRSITKEPMAIQAYLQNQDGLFATVHTDKGKLHVRLYDDTNHRIGKNGAIAIGTGAGAVAGSVFGGGKGAVIGGGIGAFAGWLTSRKSNNHDNCLVIGGLTGEATTANTAPATYQEQTQQQPVAGPAEVSTERKLIRNRFEDAQIRVYEGSRRILELNAGTEGEVEVTSSSRIWGEAYLENPKNNKMEWIPLQFGKGIDNLPQDAGWVFGNPGTKPSLQ